MPGKPPPEKSLPSKGRCPTCHKGSVPITIDGNYADHYYGVRGGPKCPKSGKPY